MKVCLRIFAKCAFLTVGLMLLVIVGNMKEAAAEIEGVIEGDFEYKTILDGKAEITCYFGNDTEVDIPETIGGLEVVRIGDWAFNGKLLTKVTIPDSVTSIGEGAFAGNMLTEVTIPDSVTSIENYTFEGNQSLSFPLMPVLQP
jgi:hypothetical protein